MEHVTEAWRWQRMLGRIEQARAGATDLIKDSIAMAPEWPADKSRIVKVALLEAERALKRAEDAAGGAVYVAKLDELTA